MLTLSQSRMRYGFLYVISSSHLYIYIWESYRSHSIVRMRCFRCLYLNVKPIRLISIVLFCRTVSLSIRFNAFVLSSCVSACCEITKHYAHAVVYAATAAAAVIALSLCDSLFGAIFIQVTHAYVLAAHMTLVIDKVSCTNEYVQWNSG